MCVDNGRKGKLVEREVILSLLGFAVGALDS